MKRVALVLVALLAVGAGCMGSTGQTPQEFENSSDLVQNVNTNSAESVTFTVTDNAHYTTQDCWFNPAIKVTQCDYTDHPTDISNITITNSGETVRVMDEKTNYEGETVEVNINDGADNYTVVLEYASGHTNSFSFNQTENGNLTFTD